MVYFEAGAGAVGRVSSCARCLEIMSNYGPQYYYIEDNLCR